MVETWSWMIELEDDIHIIELDHDPDSGEKTIKLNDHIIVNEKDEKKNAGVYKFFVGNMPCLVYIKYFKKKFEYELRY